MSASAVVSVGEDSAVEDTESTSGVLEYADPGEQGESTNEETVDDVDDVDDCLLVVVVGADTGTAAAVLLLAIDVTDDVFLYSAISSALTALAAAGESDEPVVEPYVLPST